MPNHEPKHTSLDRQIDSLAGRLREEGLPPDRDLWPAIDEALDRLERPGRRHSPMPAFWRAAALAACLVLVVGLGYVGRNTGGKDQGNLTEVRRLDATLQDLNAALQKDPENQGLARLVLMVHRSRADVLRGGWGL